MANLFGTVQSRFSSSSVKVLMDLDLDSMQDVITRASVCVKKLNVLSFSAVNFRSSLIYGICSILVLFLDRSELADWC